MTDSTPQRHLTRIAALYPKFWRRFEGFRDDRGCGISDWPSWCYCPLAGAYAIVSGGGSNRVPIDRAHLVGELGAVAAWRPTKGIYRFDLDLAAALVSTPLDRELPTGVLERLPEWCVWIDPVAGLPGFFAFLEYDAGDGRTELRLAIDNGEDLSQLIVHLGKGSILDGLEAMVLESAANMALQTRVAVPVVGKEALSSAALYVAPFVSLLLYLCADEPDLGDRQPPKHPSQSKRTTGAATETVWAVGERIGAALRAASNATSGEPADGTHASPRPHVRRAHWHTYWTGPRGAQQTRCRWLAPILVGAGETVPTMHDVDVKPN
jgi:hypothetical protein